MLKKPMSSSPLEAHAERKYTIQELVKFDVELDKYRVTGPDGVKFLPQSQWWLFLQEQQIGYRKSVGINGGYQFILFRENDAGNGFLEFQNKYAQLASLRHNKEQELKQYEKSYVA